MYYGSIREVLWRYYGGIGGYYGSIREVLGGY